MNQPQAIISVLLTIIFAATGILLFISALIHDNILYCLMALASITVCFISAIFASDATNDE